MRLKERVIGGEGVLNCVIAAAKNTKPLVVSNKWSHSNWRFNDFFNQLLINMDFSQQKQAY